MDEERDIRIAALKDQNEIMRNYNNELRAEIERLRAALQEINKVAYSHRNGSIGIAQRIATAALADQGKG